MRINKNFLFLNPSVITIDLMNIRKIKKTLRKIRGITKPRWPTPEYDDNNQPHFLFLITPPYSGSTAIAKILDTGRRTMTLSNNGEGQWLIPGLCKKDRWNPDKKVNYKSIKAVWLNKYQSKKKLNQDIEVVIEKSPPNMVRIENITSLFKNHSFLANNRNPYANCASILYRLYNPTKISMEKRKRILEQLAEGWLMRSRRIKELIIKYKVPLLTYEQFCQNPSSILDSLNLPKGVSEDIDINAEVKVKDYKPQIISNHNERQISNLTKKDIENINHILEKERNLLDFFGYDLLKKV